MFDQMVFSSAVVTLSSLMFTKLEHSVSIPTQLCNLNTSKALKRQTVLYQHSTRRIAHVLSESRLCLDRFLPSLRVSFLELVVDMKELYPVSLVAAVLCCFTATGI